MTITNEPEAILWLIDNSQSSRNGDFSPNRLDAQAEALRKLGVTLKTESAKNQLGYGVTAGENVILQSLTNVNEFVKKRMTGLQVTNGQPRLGRAISSAFLCMRHRDIDLKKNRIIATIATTSMDLETEEQCDALIKTIQQEQKRRNTKKQHLLIDLIVFGCDVNMEPLTYIRDKCEGIVRIFEFPYEYGSLRDMLMQPGILCQAPVVSTSVQGIDPELKKAIAESIMSEDDAALQQALFESLESLNPSRNEEEKSEKK